jgi:putative endonuclease
MGPFFYTYVLLCANGELYIGSSQDLWARISEHENGRVTSTAPRRPVALVYYEACRSLPEARRREKQLKTGYGRAYLRRRLAFEFRAP